MHPGDSGHGFSGDVKRRFHGRPLRVSYLPMERNAKRSFEVHIDGEQLREVGKPVKWFRRLLLRCFQHFCDGSDSFFRDNPAGTENHEPEVVMKNDVGWEFEFHASKSVTGGEDVSLRVRSFWNRTLV